MIHPAFTLLLICTLGFIPHPVLAQVFPDDSTTGSSCTPGAATAQLNVNGVKADVFNTGSLFYSHESSAGYEVPEGSGLSPILAAGTWIAGLQEDEVRVAAATYGQFGRDFEFFPGPIENPGNDFSDCSSFDRLYRIYRVDLDEYERTGSPVNDLREWPYHLGAPVIDGDGIAGNYDLEHGDRPEMFGDQMVWWVMNDAAGPHQTTLSDPVGMEVQGTAYAFDREEPFLKYTTFYRYRLVYKGSQPLERAFFGIWADTDLGDPNDDFAGSDTLRHLGYTYNGDDFDGTTTGYGQGPPAFGFAILKGPVADPDTLDNDYDGVVDEPGERAGLRSFILFMKIQGSPYFYPTQKDEYYNWMQGLWIDSSPIPYGWIYREDNSQKRVTRYMYPGNPPEYWSEENIDGAGRRETPTDRRFFMSTGPFTMQPGDTQEITFAIVWARGGDRLDSVHLLKQYVDQLMELTHIDVESSEMPGTFALAPNFPNPFRSATTIRFNLPETEYTRIMVYDLLGRPITVLADGVFPAGSHVVTWNAGQTAGGTYFYRLDAGSYRETRIMTLVH